MGDLVGTVISGLGIGSFDQFTQQYSPAVAGALANVPFVGGALQNLAQDSAVFGKILVPTEEVVEMKSGQKNISERKFFPGYVLVEMDMTDEAWNAVLSLNVTSEWTGNDYIIARVSVTLLGEDRSGFREDLDLAVVETEAAVDGGDLRLDRPFVG